MSGRGRPCAAGQLEGPERPRVRCGADRAMWGSVLSTGAVWSGLLWVVGRAVVRAFEAKSRRGYCSVTFWMNGIAASCGVVRWAMAEMKTDVWGRLFGGDAVKSIIRENKKERVNC